VVVPDLEHAGGISTVAEFVCETIERSRTFTLRIVSLAMSYRDQESLSLTRPTSWRRGVTTAPGTWHGRQFIRVGTWASEFEFQRYRPRRALTEALAGCDVVQVVCGSPAVARAVCGLGKPVAVHCATRAVIERRSRHAVARGPVEAWRRCMTTVTNRMDRRALQSVDTIQAMNAWMFDYARAVNAGRRTIVRYVPPGVDAHRFTPLSKRDLRTDPYILCVGRLNDERKNVALLLRAFSLLPSTLEPTRLVLAGSAGPSPDFWRLVDELGLRRRVTMTESPSAEELLSLYRSASVFALGSDEEGFGMVILEAMACEVPVVSTRSGGPDGIIRDSHDGYLVAVQDVAGFADRLARLLSNEDLNRRMGSAGRRTVLAKFDSHIAGKALLETYDALLDRRVRPSLSISSAGGALCGNR
jgi:D-inositol-3-phosphate glycosyltransferase